MQWAQHDLRRVLNRAITSHICDADLASADRRAASDARRARRCAAAGPRARARNLCRVQRRRPARPAPPRRARRTSSFSSGSGTRRNSATHGASAVAAALGDEAALVAAAAAAASGGGGAGAGTPFSNSRPASAASAAASSPGAAGAQPPAPAPASLLEEVEESYVDVVLQQLSMQLLQDVPGEGAEGPEGYR
jgi:hypothetical protein